jgi:hypothetical protein
MEPWQSLESRKILYQRDFSYQYEKNSIRTHR